MRVPLGILAFGLLATTFSTARGLDPENFVKYALEDNKVQIFSKSYCPYCKNSKQLLDGIGVHYHADELDQLHEGPQVQEELLKLTGQRTVPNIFIGGKHLGGNDELMKARSSGKLKTLLKEAGVKHNTEL